MRKIGLLFALSLLWVTVGCSDNPTQADEANGHTPTEIAVRYLTAEIENNIRRRMELATPTLQESLKESTEDSYEYYSPYKLQFGPENKNQLDKNYQLEEFKLNETTYFYRFSGAYKSGDILKDRILKVTLYKGNWKVEETNAEDNFKQNEAKMESIIVKESDQEPIFQEQITADYKEDEKKGKLAEKQDEKYFASDGEIIKGYSPADVALLYHVLATNNDYLRLSKIITQEEKDRLNKKKTNLLISWDWSYTIEKSELQAYYENRMEKNDSIIEMKKDNTTYFYLIDSLYYVKVKKENGEWKAQEDGIRVDGTSEWKDLEEKEVFVELKIP